MFLRGEFMKYRKILISFLLISCASSKVVTSPKESVNNSIKNSRNFLNILPSENINQRNPAGLIERPRFGYKLTWSDEFNGAAEAVSEGEDPTCFDNKPLQCKRNYWWITECDQQMKDPRNQVRINDSNLTRDLNKCVWAVYTGAHGGGDPAQSTYDANMVEVKNGYLILRNKLNEKTFSEYDCGVGSVDLDIGNLGSWAQHYSNRCYFVKGAIDSKPVEGRLRGFLTQYGRVEVRAKLPDSPGSWPAHWMMPGDDSKIPDQYKGWPEAGEIDIMEMWMDKHDEVVATYHNGDKTTKTHFWKGRSWKAHQQYYPELKTKKQREDTFIKDFHTFAVEWEQDELRFYVDNYLVNRVVEGERVFKLNKGYIGKYKIPEWPFHLILNNQIANWGSKKYWPTQENWKDSVHYIDYVRVYHACHEADQNCIFFNTTNRSKDKCPLIMKSLGDYLDGTPICKSPLALKIKEDKCIAQSGIVYNGYCLENKKGKYFVAHKLSESENKCPLAHTFVGSFLDGMSMCKPLMASMMTNRECNGKGGASYKDYCLRNIRNKYYKANPMKEDSMGCKFGREKLGEYQGMPICKVSDQIKRKNCDKKDGIILKPLGHNDDYCLIREIDWYKAKKIK